MQQELLRAQQEMHFEAAIEGLRKPGSSGVDIENSLADLSNVRGISFPQARQVLGFATSNIPAWIEAAGGEVVIAAISPSIDTLRAHAETSDDEKVKAEFATLSSQLVSGIVLAEPESYRAKLAAEVRSGRFGEPKTILSGVAVSLLTKANRGQGYGDGSSETVARVLDDVVALDDPTLLEPVKAALPLEWLDGDFGEEDFKKQFPRVHQFLEQAFLSPEEKHLALARMFDTSAESQRERLKKRIRQGEFGDAIDVLGKVVGVLASSEVEAVNPTVEDRDRDSLTEDLWIELLEINRRDPRLRPLRERLIGRGWYWDSDSLIYTLTETMDGMALPVGEEEVFIARHEDAIVNRLLDVQRGDDKSSRKYREGLKLTHQRGEFSGRLAAVLQEVRQMMRDNKERSAEDIMSTDLLFASLYTPVKLDAPKK